MYESLKMTHIIAATLSICGFLLRGWWMMMTPEHLQRRWVKVLPHIVDTIFLLSGIALFLALRLTLAQNGWLQIKLVALVVYVLLGSIALKRGKTAATRLLAFVSAVVCFAYIVGVALSKSAASWLSLAAG